MKLKHIFSIRLFVFTWLFLQATGIPHSAIAAQNISGKVVDVISAGGFTYVEVDTGRKKVWAAGTGAVPLKKGDPVSFPAEMPMNNYHSKVLGRDFSIIYFVSSFNADESASPIDSLHAQTSQKSKIKPYAATIKKKSLEVKVGSNLRAATLDGLNGSNKKFSDYKGKPLIINVWASWCSPCRAEMGSLQRLANRYNGKQFNIIGISTDDYRDKAENFIKLADLTFENFIDHNLVLEKMLGANTIPLTILVNDQGRVLHKVRGTREWDSQEMITLISQHFALKLN